MPGLTDEMKRAIKELHLCYVASVSPQGQPNLSPKGTLQVWDDDHLVFADIASPKTVANVLVNPHVEINIVNPFSRRGFRFKGRAEVLHSGREFETVAGELRARNGPTFPVRNVVKVRVDVARPVLSPAYTCNPPASEDETRRKWMAFYGVRPAAGGRGNSAEKSRSPTSASPRGS
jgi:predicted pyridoxine 5'-phosphate oxidase superfamily flavin-nucleotide-binding protein